MSNTVQSVERAFTLLELVVERMDGIGVRELAREAGLKAPTAQHLLKTLQTRGYLYFNPDSRRYHPGQSLTQLCQKIDPIAALRETLRGPLQDFHQQNGETTIAQTLVNGEARILLEFSANHPLTVRHGEVVITDPHLWASGSVVLAWQDDTYLKQYAQSRSWSTSVEATFRQALSHIHEAQIAIMVDVNDSGVAAIGAPVLDARGHLICALGCSVPLARWSEAVREQLVREINTLANSFSIKI